MLRKNKEENGECSEGVPVQHHSVSECSLFLSGGHFCVPLFDSSAWGTIIMQEVRPGD